jgi:hypothetical protein
VVVVVGWVGGGWGLLFVLVYLPARLRVPVQVCLCDSSALPVVGVVVLGRAHYQGGGHRRGPGTHARVLLL